MDVILQDTFTFTDQGKALYSGVLQVTDGTPGFDEGLDYGVTSAGGVISRNLADSFTFVSKFLRDLVTIRQPQDISTVNDTIIREVTPPIWRRAKDVFKEVWGHQADTDIEHWDKVDRKIFEVRSDPEFTVKVSHDVHIKSSGETIEEWSSITRGETTWD